MRLAFFLATSIVLGQAVWSAPAEPTANSPDDELDVLKERLVKYEKIVDDMAGFLSEYRQTISNMAKHMMQMELFAQERIRSDGHSGAKQMRVDRDGTRSFFSNSHVGTHIMAMHNHANYDRTVGLGEMNIVLNGVDFKTRHNDYKLRMPSLTSSAYEATEFIDFPPVPPSVLQKDTVEKQVTEMKEWFRAFINQDYQHRDYRPYFKPLMCYLEGAWTLGKDITEPFQSDRHYLDASSWADLEEKIRYTAQSGTKSILENYAYLPSIIHTVTDGIPSTAQWTYRILCSPINFDLPTSYFKLEDDLMVRMSRNMTSQDVLFSRMARFRLVDSPEDKVTQFTVLDKIMQSIPGKNNYPAKLYDDSFGVEMESIENTSYPRLNTGYYSRYYRTEKVGAMGTRIIHRGFSDENLWVAQTTHPQVMPVSVTDCARDPVTHELQNDCTPYSNRYTYALPLEVIYMTPLLSWNPYNLSFAEVDNNVYRSSVQGGRNGGLTKDTAYNGTNLSVFYRTPSEFFVGDGNGDYDPADTAHTGIGVLDRQGNVRSMAASGRNIDLNLTRSHNGTRIFAEIADVGKFRFRYPIMPVHGEGSGVWKELNALKYMLKRQQ